MKKVRARRLDTRYPNKWEAQVEGRPVGRARTKEGALKIALERAKETREGNKAMRDEDYVPGSFFTPGLRGSRHEALSITSQLAKMMVVLCEHPVIDSDEGMSTLAWDAARSLDRLYVLLRDQRSGGLSHA